MKLQEGIYDSFILFGGSIPICSTANLYQLCLNFENYFAANLCLQPRPLVLKLWNLKEVQVFLHLRLVLVCCVLEKLERPKALWNLCCY